MPFCSAHRRSAPIYRALAVVALIVLTVGGVPAPVAAQDSNIQQLLLELERLRNDMSDLQRFVYKGGEVPPPSLQPTTAAPAVGGGDVRSAQLEVRFSQVEDEMRRLTGRVEEVAHGIELLGQRIDKLVADVDFRLRTLEGGGGQATVGPGTPAPAGSRQFAPPRPPQPAPGPGEVVINQEGAPGPSRRFGTLTESQLRSANINPSGVGAGGGSTIVQPGTQPAAASAGDASGLPPGSPEVRYNYARGFLMRRDFEGAEQALQAFVNTYPENELAGNAQYWLGETFYVRNDFGTAARTFADGFQRYPDSSKAPDNLLKLGMSLAALERTEDACITLQKLSNEYPKAAANIMRRAEDERSRLKCQ